jgi:hypothetical protein
MLARKLCSAASALATASGFGLGSCNDLRQRSKLDCGRINRWRCFSVSVARYASTAFRFSCRSIAIERSVLGSRRNPCLSIH